MYQITIRKAIKYCIILSFCQIDFLDALESTVDDDENENP